MSDGKLDFDGLGSALLGRAGDLLAEWLPGGKLVGKEYECGNLAGGPGDSFRVNITTGKWADFASNDKGGDLIALYAKQQGIKQGEAAKILAEKIGYRLGGSNGSAPPKPSDPKPEPPPEGEKPPRMIHRAHGQHTRSWVYRDGKGKPLFYVARYDTDTGKGKEFCPWTWIGGRWRQKSWPAPRPLYGLEILAKKHSAPVMVVEGEKAADAARIMAPIYAVVTWPNGSKAAHRTSWEPLKGRSILIWPDADEPGKEVAEVIAKELVEICPSVKVIDPGDKPEGWDAADALADGWDWKELVAWAKPRATERKKAPAKEPDKEESPKGSPPFQVLGYNQGSYYYLPQGARQVVELRADSHSKLNLLRLAPLWWWSQEYKSQMGVGWILAANNMIRQCEKVGIYDPERIRGRGAWWDTDKAVLHLGDVLVTEDSRTPIMSVKPGKFIYEAAPSISLEAVEPLRVGEARKILEICDLISWEKPIFGRLLAGWIVVAPICGALDWRPHIWITGPAGCGKTYIADKIIRRLVGPIGLAVQGETTEAGIRQTLGHDARPIIFDEAEGESERAHMRIQNTLALMRQSSSETGAKLLKGTVGGEAKSYLIRSCFAFASVGVGVQQYADATRVSVLSMVKDDDQERFKKLDNMVNDLLTPAFTARLLARSFAMIPTLRENTRTFTVAGAREIGSQRLGDQVGALVAGAYSLTSDKEIEPDLAREWVEDQDWSEQRAVQETTDETSCLQQILSHVVRVSTSDRIYERTIDELIQAASGNAKIGFVQVGDALPSLLRVGIRVDEMKYTIANSHPALAKILHGTPWGHSWGRVLRRIKGAESSSAAVRFFGVKSRGVVLPIGEPADAEPLKEDPGQDDSLPL